MGQGGQTLPQGVRGASPHPARPAGRVPQLLAEPPPSQWHLQAVLCLAGATFPRFT